MKNKHLQKLKKTKKYFQDQTQFNYLLRILIIEQLKISPNNFYLNNFEINFFSYLKIKIKIIKFIFFKIPLAYLIKKKNFFNFSLIVNKNCLIPRFETESLVILANKIISIIFLKDSLAILDLCCGSLAIAAAIRKLRNNKNDFICASDKYRKVLKIAKKNNKNLNTKINLLKSNFLKNIKKQHLKFNVIICNPPYISKDFLLNSFVKKEPKHALITKNDNFFQKILNDFKFCIFKNHLLFFEISEFSFLNLKKILNKNYSKLFYFFINDLNNKIRFLILTYNQDINLKLLKINFQKIITLF